MFDEESLFYKNIKKQDTGSDHKFIREKNDLTMDAVVTAEATAD